MKNQCSEQSIPAWLPTELFPFASKFIEIDGHAIHYVDEGIGPTLLLLHGNPTWCFLYREIIARLKDRFRCIALDYPGFGLSQAAIGYDFLPESHARLVDSFVRSLDLGEFSIMVQDWGGPIGLWLAARRDAQVKALIIGNTWAWPIDGDPHFERFSNIMGGAIGKFAIRNFNAFVNVMIPMGVKRKKLDSRVMTAYRSPFPTKDSRLPTNIFPREIRSSRIFLAETQSGLTELSLKPALILWGDKDIAFRKREREQFEKIFVNHRTVILYGAGHYIQEDAPEEIAAAIVKWRDKM